MVVAKAMAGVTWRHHGGDEAYLNVFLHPHQNEYNAPLTTLWPVRVSRPPCKHAITTIYIFATLLTYLQQYF
jgi:hypothetical protein